MEDLEHTKSNQTNISTRRLQSKKQTLDDAYAAPANFLEIDVVNPITHGVARARYTDYEVRMRVSQLGTYYLKKKFFYTNSLEHISPTVS